jgi:hypothetical protein
MMIYDFVECGTGERQGWITLETSWICSINSNSLRHDIIIKYIYKRLSHEQADPKLIQNTKYAAAARQRMEGRRESGESGESCRHLLFQTRPAENSQKEARVCTPSLDEKTRSSTTCTPSQPPNGNPSQRVSRYPNDAQKKILNRSPSLT